MLHFMLLGLTPKTLNVGLNNEPELPAEICNPEERDDNPLATPRQCKFANHQHSKSLGYRDPEIKHYPPMQSNTDDISAHVRVSASGRSLKREMARHSEP